FALRVIRKARVRFVPTRVPVIADKVNRAELSVFVHFANDATESLTFVRRIARSRTITIKTERQQPTVRGSVKTHPLMHHRGHSRWNVDSISTDRRQRILREDDLRPGPRPPVFRGR